MSVGLYSRDCSIYTAHFSYSHSFVNHAALADLVLKPYLSAFLIACMQSRIFITVESLLIPKLRGDLLDFVTIKDAIDNLQVCYCCKVGVPSALGRYKTSNEFNCVWSQVESCLHLCLDPAASPLQNTRSPRPTQACTMPSRPCNQHHITLCAL